MKFSSDQYYGVSKNGDVTESLKEPLYRKDEVVEVPEEMVARWLKRGGVIVAEEKTDGRAQEAAKVEDKPADKAPETQEQVEGADKKDDDGGKSDSAKNQNAKPGDKGGNKR